MPGTNDTYKVPAGTTAYIGKYGKPSWVANAVSGRWGTVPVAAALNTLDPKLNPALNPVYPDNPEWNLSGHSNIIAAWCGACFDDTQDALWLPLSGGHADYAGNEPYKLELNKEIPNWSMVRPPSGAVGNILTTNDGQEGTGVYSDGRPRSIHSYNKPCYVPNVGPFIISMGNTSWSGQAGPNKPVRIDPGTGEGTLMAACTAASLGGGARIICSAFDPTRGSLGSMWGRNSGFGKMQRYDVATNTWSQEIGPSVNFSNYISLCYLPGFDYILLSAPEGLHIYDCGSSTWHTPTVTGTPVASWSGCQLVLAKNNVYTWNNSSSTTLITKIELGADPKTALTVSTIDVDVGNLVTPTSKASNGTYGRFWYSSRLECFFLFNSTSGLVYFFKI